MGGFTWNYTQTDFLFQNFNIDNVTICLVIVAAVFAASLFIEFLKYIEYLINKKFDLNLNETITSVNNVNYSSTRETASNESNDLISSLRIPASLENIIFKRKLVKHIIFTLFRMVSLTVAYVLMLIVMNDYWGHLLAVVFGFTVGHYFFDTNTEHYKCTVVEKTKKTDDAKNDDGDNVQASTSAAHTQNYGSIHKKTYSQLEPSREIFQNSDFSETIL